MTKLYMVAIAVCMVTSAVYAQRVDTLVLSVYNTGQRFMLYPMPFGKAKPDSIYTTEMVLALDTLNVLVEQPDSLGNLVSVWGVSRSCGKLSADVRGKIALLSMLPSCDVSTQVLAAQNAGALSVVMIHTTNHRDSVVLPRQPYAVAEAITIPCYTVRSGIGDKIRAMLPSLASLQVVEGLVGSDVQNKIVMNPNNGLPIVTAQTPADSATTIATKTAANQFIRMPIGWALSPNPARTEVVLEYHFAEAAPMLIEIFNEVGQLVTNYQWSHTDFGKLRIDVENWQSGAYNVRIQHDKCLEIKRFVVIH
jgi:Secretion system C-terminal sorting domain/PA domain